MSQNNFMKDTVYDVFISYSSKNKNVIDALCHFLEEKKIRCWIAPRDILPGQEYAEAIVQAMKKVKIFVLVCSNHSLQSKWVHKETNLALSDDKIIIPCKIEDCSVEETGMKLYLNDRHWIDAFPNPDESFGDLVAAITALLEGMRPPASSTPICDKERSATTSTDGIKIPPPESSNCEKMFRYNESKDKIYSQKQILAIAKFQIWLFYCMLITIFLYICFAWNIEFLCAIAVIHYITFAKLRFLEKENIAVTIFAILFMGPYISFIIFLFEMFHSKKILHAAGIKKTFPWVAKSVIVDFSQSK